MTHNDIYTKFMIEYDKANVTSSYPALTKYEVATLLDRAYLTLIARKLTGNNTRRVPFEYDTKAIEDLRPLVVTSKFNSSTETATVSNEYTFTLPPNLMYYLEGVAEFGTEREIVQPINHLIARKFKATNSNIPWINSPVSYIEGSSIHVFVDPFEHKTGPEFDGTYIKKPASFVSSLSQTDDPTGGEDPNPGGGGGGGDDTSETIPAPVINGVNNFTNSTSITISIPTGTNVYYTINDGDPTSSSTEYLVPFTINNTSTIKAIAIKGNNRSSITTLTFTKTDNTYKITYTNKPTNVYNLSQTAIYSATASNGITISGVTFSIISGSEYAHISNNKLTIKNTATDTKTIILRATCDNDTSIYEEFNVNVKYYSSPVDTQIWQLKEVYKSGFENYLVSLQGSIYIYLVFWKNNTSQEECGSNIKITSDNNINVELEPTSSSRFYLIIPYITEDCKITITATCEKDSSKIYTETIDVFPQLDFYRTIKVGSVNNVTSEPVPRSSGGRLGFYDGSDFIDFTPNIQRYVYSNGTWKVHSIEGYFTGLDIPVVTEKYTNRAKYVLYPGTPRKNSALSDEYEIVGWTDGVNEKAYGVDFARVFPDSTTNNISLFNLIIRKKV